VVPVNLGAEKSFKKTCFFGGYTRACCFVLAAYRFELVFGLCVFVGAVAECAWVFNVFCGR